MGRLFYIGAIAAALAGAWHVAGNYISGNQEVAAPLAEWNISERPEEERYLYDYAGILGHFEEGLRRYLKHITRDFHIEAVILTLPKVPTGSDVDQIASDVLNNWRIGGNYDGRAVLLLLDRDRQEVRMEVAYELEDVFTDAFVGFVEDKQLKPYFLEDDVGTGLIALMEELERRAELKQQGEYTSELIASLDSEFISGGAGAKRDLKKYSQTNDTANGSTTASTRSIRGARSPEEAWRTMLAKWAGQGSDLDIDIYTEMTRMAMGDPERPDPRTKEALPHWQNAEFRVLRKNGYAVIYFGYKKGWDNAPFLFCRDQQGWKFDIVYQRRLVVMGAKQSWFVEQGRFPYVSLLAKVPQSTGKDLPLSARDLYRCSDDSSMAARMNTLAARLDANPDDYDSVLELLRLNVITGRRPNHVQPLIERAKSLNPDDPIPYKYAAIYNVNSFFQYKTALNEIEAYLDHGGDVIFGHSVEGFLHYRLNQYEKAVVALDKVLNSAPNDIYALSLLARVYGLRYLGSSELDPRRAHYQAKAKEYLRRAQDVPEGEVGRVSRVTNWMQSKGLL